jgi:CDGSH iron-sulfur domain-containing protein 3
MQQPSDFDPRDAANVPEPAPPTRAGGPIERDETPGFVAWCRCARSRHVPYCDGAHGGTGLEPLIVEIDRAARVRWCGCGRTSTPPRCDERACRSVAPPAS